MSANGQFNIASPLCRRWESRGATLTRRLFLWLIWLWCCSLCLSLPVLPAATLVHSPYLQNLQADHVTIVWSARENLAGTVRYSTDGSFSESITASVREFKPAQTGMTITFYQYQADLTGLARGAAYSYKVFIGGQDVTPETDYQFRTPGPGAFSFLVFGDSGDGSGRQLAVLDQMRKEQPGFVIHVGDIAYDLGTFQEFTDHHFSVYLTLMRRACFFAIGGNHEYYSANAIPYVALHAPPTDTVPIQDQGRYYSFDWGNVHFVGLDANLLDVGFAAQKTRMLSWLENDLATARASWKVAFFHQTPYATFHHADDPIDIAARELFVPILERYGVQLVLAGHEHNYQRSKPMRAGAPISSGAGTVYVTSGGGGGGLHDIRLPKPDFLEHQAMVNHYLRVDVDGAQFTIHAIGVDGKEFDKVQLSPPPVFAPANPVVNGATFQPSVAPGAFVSIFGQGLASGTGTFKSFPLPTTLAGSAVTLNGVPIALTFASPTQINAALPLDVLGPATLRVTTPMGFAETQVNISDTAPGIFPLAITHANGTLVSTTAPGLPGETLVIYMTGLGQVDGPLAAGQAAPAVPLLRVLATPVEVQIGDTLVTPDFAGLTPGFFDLYQVNIKVPQNLPTRIYPLRVSVRGTPSNFQNLQLQGRTQ